MRSWSSAEIASRRRRPPSSTGAPTTTEIGLTRRGVDLLEYLARRAGEPVTREELAAHVWHAAPSHGGTNIVDVYVSYLRRKLAGLGRESVIRSVRGVGYQLCPTDPERYRSPDPQTHVASGAP